MRLEISFEAAEILNETTLRWDEPDVWSRYLANRIIRFGKRLGARVYTTVGLHDLRVIRNYFCMWLQGQELVPDHLRDREDESLMWQARIAIGDLTRVIDSLVTAATLPADSSV